MILADTSIWIDHLRRGDGVLAGLLENGQVLTHPFIIGEIALGRLNRRQTILGSLQDLPRASVADEAEVLGFIDREKLFGFGIGYVDAHLLTATRLTAGARLWTRDKRLTAAARRLHLAAGVA